MNYSRVVSNRVALKQVCAAALHFASYIQALHSTSLLIIMANLARTLTNLFRDAGIEGYFTNHSLRVTAATRMFDAGVDEQLIMSRTGHSSTVGVRSYKRITSSLKEKTSNVLNGPSGPDTSSTSQTSVDNNPINKENNPANHPILILVGLLISQLIFISNYTNIVL